MNHCHVCAKAAVADYTYNLPVDLPMLVLRLSDPRQVHFCSAECRAIFYSKQPFHLKDSPPRFV
jgi:predicted nucleic acid-binding Zn ribbon protein